MAAGRLAGYVCMFSKFSDFDETWYPNVFHDAKSESEVNHTIYNSPSTIWVCMSTPNPKQQLDNLNTSDFDETWYPNVFWAAKSESEVSFSKF